MRKTYPHSPKNRTNAVRIRYVIRQSFTASSAFSLEHYNVPLCLAGMAIVPRIA